MSGLLAARIRPWAEMVALAGSEGRWARVCGCGMFSPLEGWRDWAGAVCLLFSSWEYPLGAACRGKGKLLLDDELVRAFECVDIGVSAVGEK